MSFSSLLRTLNDIICVDHMFVDQRRVLHVMDSTTRYHAGSVVDVLTTVESIDTI